MKLIIDIDEELYEDIKYNFEKKWYCECGGYRISSIIVNGTPLEKYEDIIELYLGMSESMQKAVKDVMIVTQENK